MKKISIPIFLMAICIIAAAGQNSTSQNAAGQDTATSNNQMQSHEPPAVLEIVRESVKEGRTGAHEKVEADWAAAFRKHNFPDHQLGLTSMTGPAEALFLVGFPSFARVEQANLEFQKAGTKAEMEMLDARDGELRASSRTMYAVYRKDMSYRPDLVDIAKTRYVGVATFRVKLGRMQDFEEGGKKFLAADEKAGLKTPSVAYQVIAGAPADVVFFLEPMESLKSLDEYPAREKAVAEAMGEDYQKMMRGSGEVFTSIEYGLYAVNPRMSYVSKEVEDADPAFWRPKATASKAASSKPAEKSGQ